MAYTADCTVVVCCLKIVYLFFSLNCLNILTLKNDMHFFVNIALPILFYSTSFNNYPSFSLQVPSILSILLGTDLECAYVLKTGGDGHFLVFIQS